MKYYKKLQRFVVSKTTYGPLGSSVNTAPISNWLSEEEFAQFDLEGWKKIFNNWLDGVAKFSVETKYEEVKPNYADLFGNAILSPNIINTPYYPNHPIQPKYPITCKTNKASVADVSSADLGTVTTATNISITNDIPENLQGTLGWGDEYPSD